MSLTHYRNRGYLPEALLNFVVFMGWNPGTDTEFFTMEEMIQAFDISKVQKGGAVFNVEKLNWINRHDTTPNDFRRTARWYRGICTTRNRVWTCSKKYNLLFLTAYKRLVM